VIIIMMHLIHSLATTAHRSYPSCTSFPVVRTWCSKNSTRTTVINVGEPACIAVPRHPCQGGRWTIVTARLSCRPGPAMHVDLANATPHHSRHPGLSVRPCSSTPPRAPSMPLHSHHTRL
jgi:hypothetical protein